MHLIDSTRRNRAKRSQAGFTLIESLIGLLVMSLALGALSFVIKSILDAQHSTNVLRSAATLRTALIDSVNSVQGWNRTLAFPDNLALGCLLQTNSRDCTGAQGMIAVMNGSEGVVFNALDPNMGIDEYGLPCTTYNDTAGSGHSTCILRYDVQWRALCPSSGVCSNPEVEITGTLRYNPANKRFSMNTSKFNFRIVRGLEVNSLHNACVSVHGTFDPVSRTCTLPFQGTCPMGQFVVGLSSNPTTLNQKICRPFLQSCPSGNVMVGIRSDGNVDCQPACLGAVIPGTVTPLPADGSTWTDGSWGGGTTGAGGDGCGGGSDGCV